MSYREETRKAIEQHGRKPLAAPVRQALEAALPNLPSLPTASDLVHILRGAEPESGEKDTGLLVLLRIAQAEPRNWDVLLVLMEVVLPSIELLYRKRVRMGVDRGCGDEVWKDEAWGAVQDAFRRAVARYPFERRPRSVESNLEGLTLQELELLASAETRAKRARKNFEALAVPLMDQQPPGSEGHAGAWDFRRWKRPSEPEPDEIDLAQARKSLEEYVTAGVIDEHDRQLLIGNLLENRSIRELAKTFGISWRAVKGRIERARRRLRRYRATEFDSTRKRIAKHKRRKRKRPKNTTGRS